MIVYTAAFVQCDVLHIMFLHLIQILTKATWNTNAFISVIILVS